MSPCRINRKDRCFILGRYFGTDGVRGVANLELDALLAFKIGAAAAYTLTQESAHGKKAKLLIGKDTRISSDMLENALVAGICSVGADVELLGVIPTPAVAYLTIKHKADAGIVISASHNSFEYNGIKIFAGNGYKLPDATEARIEDLIDDFESIPRMTHDRIGRVLKSEIDPVVEYTNHLAETISGDLSGLRVAVDCANGSSSTTVERLMRLVECKAEIRFYEPDGVNINDNCGSTHLGQLKERVRRGSFDLGVAFDGDADRCLGCDEKGQEMDGDKIIALLAMTMKEKGRLDGDTAVVTVMSNLGFIKYMESQGINTEKTAVGDRYVLENMRENGFAIGGEQSGHVILLHHATTGDGELTAGKLLKLLAESGKKMSELNGIYAQYPQVLVNVTANAAQKKAYKEDEVLAGFIENEQQKLMGMGRVLVRVSGTEPKIRVMVEGQDLDAIHRCADRIVDKINKRILGQ